MPQLPDFEAWAIFAKVAERESFSLAASELRLSKTTVSKAIRRLEARLGATLLHRTTRRVSLTESGRASLERALRILADGEAIEAELVGDAAIPRGLVRLTCTGAFGMRVLTPILPAFVAAYPEVEIDVHIADDPVDLVSGGFDLAIRVGPAPDSSLRVSRLFSYRMKVVGAPVFFDRHGWPQHPQDLPRLPAIGYSHVLGAEEWNFEHPEHGPCTVYVEGRIRYNNAIATIPILVSGRAMTMIPEVFIQEELATGALVTALSDWRATPIPVNLIAPPGKARPARVRALIAFLRSHFSMAAWAEGVEV